MSETRHKTKHPGIYYRNGSSDAEAYPRRYIVWFKDSAGRGRTETLPEGSNLKEALARQAELRGKQSRGERIVVSTVTLQDFAREWLKEQEGLLKPKTHVGYTWAVEKHIVPRIGRLRLSEVTVDDVANLVAAMKQPSKENPKGLKAWTIRGVLTPLSRIFRTAERRGLVSSNPVRGLDKSERPKSDQRKMRILSSVEIKALLPKVPTRFRVLITLLVFTGLRISEALALTWDDIDLAGGFVHVREGKTTNAPRAIVLMPTVGKRLREHKLASDFSSDTDLVFPTSQGRPQSPSNVLKRGLGKGLTDSGVAHCTLHELRHTFASILIGQGLDVTFVADQLGHADPAITLRIYAKLFDPASRRDEARKGLEAAFGKVVSA